MKKIIKKIKEWLVWLFNKRVGQAIDAGATYEDVCKIVEEEMKK